MGSKLPEIGAHSYNPSPSKF